jgi:hypothetical protein
MGYRSLLVIMVLTCIGSLAAIAAPVQRSSDAGRGLQVQAKPVVDSRMRVALVVGNSRYAVSPLTNPVNDARAMAEVLRRLGFEVHERIDSNYADLHLAIDQFGNRLKPGGVGLFFYAGHGMQVQGSNYLIPVDARINAENEVRYKAVDVGLVLAKMEQARGDINIVILDACRDNPFNRSFRSSSRGLASMDAPTGTLIAYATAPGKTAADGDGRNGLFTSELLRVIQTPGLRVEDVFKQIRKSVREKSGNSQIPWESSSLEGNFHFNPQQVSPESVTLPPQPPVQAVSLDTAAPPPNYLPASALQVESPRSPPENLAYNRQQTGFPSPLESDRGWGGGSSKWQLVDGQRTYPNEWARGLAFTGGPQKWAGESCGWRQATISFGKLTTFDRVVLWHHGQDQIPTVCSIQVFQQGRWRDLLSSSDCKALAPYAKTGGTEWWQGWSTPMVLDFEQVTAEKVRYRFDNCTTEHGWLYEFEVYRMK